MQKRRPKGSGAVLLAGERSVSNISAPPCPHLDELSRYRALHVMQTLGVRPTVATALATLAFGGTQ
jgi:hypothetical protein